MKNFYYFSKSKLKFVEIRNFYRKFVFLVAFFTVLCSLIIFGSYFVINEIVNPNAQVEALEQENLQLNEKLTDLLDNYKNLTGTIDSLSEVNNYLRLATNLEPADEDDVRFGTGGSIFPEVNPINSKDVGKLVNTLDAYVEQLNYKINYEKSSYTEIEKALKYNEKLYDNLPAIKPSTGYFGDRFGMRMHPILKIRRMHNGLDIVANVGTKVYAPGGGKVEFTGRRGGSGLTLEIDHGFGYKTLYLHLSKILVKRGQKIKRGDLIALTGNSGKLSAGAHLHYEVRHNGIALNPRDFIYDDVKLFEIVSTQN